MKPSAWVDITLPKSAEKALQFDPEPFGFPYNYQEHRMLRNYEYHSVWKKYRLKPILKYTPSHAVYPLI